MARGFAERLDFVMDVTRTTNSALARALSFDASYICRIRNGKRGLPRNQPFADPAATYLASRVADDRQRHALEEEIGRPWPLESREAAALLANWLLVEAGDGQAVHQALAALGTFMANAPNPAPNDAEGPWSPTPNQQLPHVSFHYGNSGKRDAVLAFLERLAAEGRSHDLLLHSDEDMSWLYEDDSFAQEWTALLLKVIGNGCRVRIVHAISRDANEMWEAVGKWMPLYMTGAVEPHYYPRLRDGVYRRTLFVASGHSAVAAASVGAAPYDGLNMLVYDPDAVASYEREFESYFALCRPLMSVSFPESPRELAGVVADFAGGEGELLALPEGGKLVGAWADGPALVANTKAPLVAFGIDERRMAAAVWGYLQSLPGTAVRSGTEARTLLAGFVEDLKRS